MITKTIRAFALKKQNETMRKEKIEYLKGKKNNWVDISREERFFCAYLYFDILYGGVNNFIQKINELNPPLKSFNKKINLDSSKYWEIGYEVCFYRDLLMNNKKKIREVNIKIENEDDKFPEKRTFDLCLFSNDEIVIIEAKAQQGLETDQCKSLKMDKKHIDSLFKIIGKTKIKVNLIILASSEYYKSKSFLPPKGVGYNLIEDSKKNKVNLSGFMSWKQIQGIYKKTPVYLKADIVYGH